MSKSYLRIIGDIHGHLTSKPGRNYTNLIQPVEYSVQLGDLGWHDEGSSFFDTLATVDPTRHRVVAGNHDCYDRLTPHYLGDFGMHSIPLREGTFDFFYIRGARSIDQMWRTIGVSWWPEEELNWEQGWEAVQQFREAKPRTVFTHDCPEAMGYVMGLYRHNMPSITNRILQSCLEVHRPELWVFGHHHRSFRESYENTLFLCLDGKTHDHEVRYIDFDEDGHLLTPIPL